MLTYGLWKSLMEEFTIYTTNAVKMGTYSLLSFISIFTVILDVATFPFQLIGILVFLITNRKK